MFNEGDKVTISRGKDRGDATIVAAAENGQYAVKTAAGNLRVVNAENLKAPQESTIGEAKLASEIETAAHDTVSVKDAAGARDVLQSLVSRLSADMPGLGARISWPMDVINDDA